MTSFDLVCPASGDVLREVDGTLRSHHGEVYPIIGGVAIIVRGVKIEPQAPLADDVLECLVEALALNPARRAAVEHAFSHKFLFEEDWIQTEADQFLYRVAASHDGLNKALGFPHRPSPPATDGAPPKPSYLGSAFGLAALRRMLKRPRRMPGPPITVEDHRPRLSSMFNLATLRARSYASINVRVENRGTTIFSNDGAAPFRLSYYWIDAGGMESEGERTDLLGDILPGQSLTNPVFIVAPRVCGRYTLSIRSLQEGVRWFDDSAVECEVDIGEGEATIDDPPWKKTGQLYSYSGDHLEGVRLLALWSTTLFDRPVDSIVELGGNASPMIGHLNAPRKYNVDIDPHGMIVGDLSREDDGRDFKYIVADGMNLPMRARSIDMLVMFATFHHFPDPIGLLSRLGEFVADDGLICLMCEPLGHVRRDTMPDEYRTEIARGVNEQSFALWEYEQMFAAADLHVVAAQVDMGSVKVALRPRR